MTESVSVTADAALLQTDTTQVGTVDQPQTIVNTALITRNPIALTLLAPGVNSPNIGTINNGGRTTGGGRPYVNGNREEANNSCSTESTTTTRRKTRRPTSRIWTRLRNST